MRDDNKLFIYPVYNKTCVAKYSKPNCNDIFDEEVLTVNGYFLNHINHMTCLKPHKPLKCYDRSIKHIFYCNSDRTFTRKNNPKNKRKTTRK